MTNRGLTILAFLAAMFLVLAAVAIHVSRQDFHVQRAKATPLRKDL